VAVFDRPPRIVITGAAHSVGRLCALSLAEWKAELILCDHDGPALGEVSSSLSCLGRFCDVASEASVAIFAADLLERYDSIDALINVAGSSYVRPLGTWRVSRALLPALRQGPGAALIVNIAARRPSDDGHFPYACSGEAAEGLNEALLNATRGSNVQVASISGQSYPAKMRSPHPSLGASQAVALVANTFGLPFGMPERRNSAA
jgi:NAD(P)-dependent dehydrogenase (short-subunit alcohol dehydrogenase family)